MDTWLSKALPFLPYMSLIGLLALVVNLLLSFEEPHGMLASVAILLVLAAPLGVAVHLATTSELTGGQKRLWLAGLASWMAPSLFTAYFTGQARADATQKLCQAAQVRKDRGHRL